MITIREYGELRRFQKWCKQFDEKSKWAETILNKYGQIGVEKLQELTPKDTGLTAASWDYYISYENGNAKITWTNSNINKGFNVAVLIFYGHMAENGVYVEGRDYINPALKPIFDDITESIKKEVFKA